MAQLALWRNPLTGQRMVKHVHRREELYAGPHVDQAPDLMIEWELDNGYSYLFRPSTGTRKASVSPLDGQERKRVKSGIIGMKEFSWRAAPSSQPRWKSRRHASSISAPTILYLLGVPIPSNLDGEVLTQIFADAYLATHPIHYAHALGSNGDSTASPHDYSAVEEEAIKARLQGLGYIE